MVWPGVVSGAVIPLVEYVYERGSDLDREMGDDAIMPTVSVAQILRSALGFTTTYIPDNDSQLVELLRLRYTPIQRTLWCIAVIDDSRVGVVTPHGMIESVGEWLALITSPEPGRYQQYYPVPGVRYIGYQSIEGES